MKRLIAASLSIAISLSASADQNECAIWLCLPIGFSMPECQTARSAMMKRLFQFESPAPSFSSCEVEGSAKTNNYDIARGQAALIGPYMHGSRTIMPTERIKDGVFCNDSRESEPEEPRGCTTTLQSYQMYENGVKVGATYYRNKQGADYIRGADGEVLLAPNQ